MANIEKNIAVMSMPKAFKRGNPIPLDASTIYYTYAAMETYAKENAIAYVGQILSLVDEENNNKVTAYIIADKAGTLKEVGSSSIGDNKSIVVAADGTISLKGVTGLDFIQRNDSGEPELDADGQVKKVKYQPLMTEEGLVWIIPEETEAADLEPLFARIEALETNVGTAANGENAATGLFLAIDTNKQAIEDLAKLHDEDKEELAELIGGYLPLNGGALTGELVLADGGKAISDKAVDAKIKHEIESAGHLKRAIVDSLPAITEDLDVDCIYMIKDPLALRDDKYEEFMVIEGEWVQIGDTSVDLANYVQKVASATEGNLAALDANGALVDAGVLAQDVIDHLADEVKHITADERTAWNEGAAQAATNAEAIAALVKISQEDADKLAELPAIKEIGNNLTLVNGVLSVVAGGTESDYVLPVATPESLGGVKIGTGLAIDDGGLVSLKVSDEHANGLTATSTGLELALATENNAGALSSELFIKLNNLNANGEANVIEGALLGANGVAASIDENKQLILPFAGDGLPGLVVSSNEDNAISVNVTTGVMTLNRVSTSNLYVPEGEELVLNGGTSK